MTRTPFVLDLPVAVVDGLARCRTGGPGHAELRWRCRLAYLRVVFSPPGPARRRARRAYRAARRALLRHVEAMWLVLGEFRGEG